MPAININMYIPPTPARPVPRYNASPVFNGSIPLDTSPASLKPANNYLTAPVYYINNNNNSLNGYVLIPVSMNFDPSTTYTFNDNAQLWQSFNDYETTFGASKVGIVTDENNNQYDVWHFGYYDEDYDSWTTTVVNVSFS